MGILLLVSWKSLDNSQFLLNHETNRQRNLKIYYVYFECNVIRMLCMSVDFLFVNYNFRYSVLRLFKY